MALNASIIKNRLSSAPSNQKDNEAQNIINDATPADLKNLDVECVLRLYEALAMLQPRIFSSNDATAMSKLKKYTQFQPVSKPLDFAITLIKKASVSLSSSHIQNLLTPELVTRLYLAEHKRLSFFERIGIDGATIGRGQLGQPSYADVKSKLYFQKALETYMTHILVPRLLSRAIKPPISTLDFNRYKINIPSTYSSIVSYPAIEDFVVAAYLAVRILAAAKADPSRPPKDVLRFSVALYHGMRPMIRNVQQTINGGTKWAPVEAELLKLGYKDQVAYVNEVVQ